MKKLKDKTDIRPKKPLGKVYFTKETEEAIVKFNNTIDELDRELIFKYDIHPAIDKLAENIINRFKFPYVEGSFDDIKNQVVSFLVLNLHKYTKDKGKAFSYFSVIAKNYLILNNNNAYRDELRSVYLSDSSTDDSFLLEEVLTTRPDAETIKSDTRDFMNLIIQYWDYNLDKIFKKRRDREIANAVVELLRRANTIENFNKKGLYIMIREMTNNKTVHITKVINKMKVHVLEQMREYRKHGHLTDSSMFFVYKNDN